MPAAIFEPPPEEQKKREFNLDDIPLMPLEELRDWLHRDGPSPALKVDDPDLREVVYEHLDMLKFALSDPINFGLAIGLDIFPQQVMTTNAVLENSKVAIRGCHSSGKSFMLAVIAVWWLLRYEDSTVITTAPTQRQVAKIMWLDIRYVSRLALRQLRIKTQACQTTQWILSEKNYAEGVSTDATVNFQGYHSQNTLIIMDEAPGIPADSGARLKALPLRAMCGL